MENTGSDITALQEENQQLKEKAASLKLTVKTLRRNFQGIVQLLTETISLDNRFLGGHMKRTAEMTKAFCEFLKLPKDIVYVNYYAALLHDIGLVGSNSDIIEKTIDNLGESDRKKFIEHPVSGFEIINSIYSLKRTAVIIRSHHENYDGTGFPDKLVGGEIPKESRIIHIINDYDMNRFKYSLTPNEACSKMSLKSGSLYDPDLYNKFESFITHFEKNNKGSSHNIEPKSLEPGMYLDQDIILSNGLLLIPSGVILDKVMIGKIQSFSSTLLGQGVIRVIY